MSHKVSAIPYFPPHTLYMSKHNVQGQMQSFDSNMGKMGFVHLQSSSAGT